MKLSKKGFQIGDVPNLVVTFGVIAIVLGVVATILSNMNESNSATGSASKVDNNTFTALNETAVFFGDYDTKANAPLGCSNVNIYNATNANKTSVFSVSGCYATLASAVSDNNTAFHAEYTLLFTTYTAQYNITQEGQEANMTLAGWQTTWVIIVASAVVLGIVSAYLFMRK